LAPVVLFSTAIPGQGGRDHLNEQWQTYWNHQVGVVTTITSGPVRDFTEPGQSPMQCFWLTCWQPSGRDGVLREEIFGLPGNALLDRLVDEAADDIRSAARSNTNLPYATSPRPATKPSPGTKSAASVPASKLPQRGSISASSSPASTPGRPGMSMRPSTAPAAKPRT